MSDPKKVHEQDQRLAAVREYAATLAAFNAALRVEGFSPTDAILLTSAFLTEQLRSTFGRKEEP